MPLDNLLLIRHRERLADVNYEIAKEQNKKITQQEILKERLEGKAFNEQHNLRWDPYAQFTLEQIELEIAISDAVIAKLVNEVKYLRVSLAALYEKSHD